MVDRGIDFWECFGNGISAPLRNFAAALRNKGEMKKYILISAITLAAANALPAGAELPYPIALEDYPQAPSLWDALRERVKIAPFNLYATAVFLCAVVHTFCYRYFVEIAHFIKNDSKGSGFFYLTDASDEARDIFSKIFHLLGEVEIIFAMWLVPLFAGFWYAYGWDGLSAYLDSMTYAERKFEEPLFVMAIMLISASKPIVDSAAWAIRRAAALGGGTVGAWWVSIMCIGPLLGSVITEPAAITISASLLMSKFFEFSPSGRLKYATVGLLFMAVSAGGTLTHFAAPPVLMVARTWGWDAAYMISTFGTKAVAGICLSTAAYYVFFKREFAELEARRKADMSLRVAEMPSPVWLRAFHMGFLAAAVLSMHYPVLLIFILMTFIAFCDVTSAYSQKLRYKSPILVAVFLSALVAHGGLQGWWIEPVLAGLGNRELFLGGMALSAFNDNAAITYLASLVPGFTESMKYMLVAGAVAAGGLTVIANAPNLAGLSVMKPHFKDGISPKFLLCGTAFPTAITALIFYFGA